MAHTDTENWKKNNARKNQTNMNLTMSFVYTFVYGKYGKVEYQYLTTTGKIRVVLQPNFKVINGLDKKVARYQ